MEIRKLRDKVNLNVQCHLLLQLSSCERNSKVTELFLLSHMIENNEIIIKQTDKELVQPT